jgi:hypothetical protein
LGKNDQFFNRPGTRRLDRVKWHAEVLLRKTPAPPLSPEAAKAKLLAHLKAAGKLTE